MGLKYKGSPASSPDDLLTLAQLTAFKADTVGTVTVVTGSEARPTGFKMIIWLGGATRPTNMANGDLWFSTESQVTPVAPTITTTTLNTMTNGVAFSQTLVVTGTTPMTFDVTAGTLPAWATLGSSTGTISGTPSATGLYDFTVTATNSVGSSTPRRYQGTVGASGTAPTITTTTLPSMTQNTAYDSGALVATGSTPITYGITAGTIPAGLSINTSTGTISGTPTGSGAYNFTVTATNAYGTDTQQFTGTIAASGGSPTEYSVLGTQTLTLGSFSDAGVGDWMANQFYVVTSALSTAGAKIKAAKLYVPAGSAHIGQTWRAALRRDLVQILGNGDAYDQGDYDNNGTKAEGSVLVAGWNRVDFAGGPWTVPASGGSWTVAVQIGNGTRYLHDGSSLTAVSIQAPGSSFYLSEADGGSVARRMFYNGSVANGRSYGIDCVVEVP